MDLESSLKPERKVTSEVSFSNSQPALAEEGGDSFKTPPVPCLPVPKRSGDNNDGEETCDPYRLGELRVASEENPASLSVHNFSVVGQGHPSQNSHSSWPYNPQEKSFFMFWVYQMRDSATPATPSSRAKRTPSSPKPSMGRTSRRSTPTRNDHQ